MSKELARGTIAPQPRRIAPYNTITFPRALKDAIPDLHEARVLKLDSVDADLSRGEFFGDHLRLNFTVRETGKLAGEFAVRVDLLPDAARALAETLTRLASELETLRP